MNPCRTNGRAAPYPEDLSEPQAFVAWLEEDVSRAQESNDLPNPEEDVVCLSQFPSPRTTKYRSMWAFGNHYHVASAEAHMKTCDSGIATIFSRPYQLGLCDQNLIVVEVEYVGNLEEIIELNYKGLCIVVLLCKWVRANHRGQQATIKKDKWGFTLANFHVSSTIWPGVDGISIACGAGIFPRQ